MLQLTETEIQRLRRRASASPHVVEELKTSLRPLLEGDLPVPETGIANWRLYYYCPDCSVSLRFDPREGKRHQCPQCGRVLTGEPYDSSWWGHINGLQQHGVQGLSWLYVLTGEVRCARRAADILLAYAARYPGYQPHGDIPYNGPGRVGAQTLDEANFQCDFATAYDRIADTMTEAERATVRDQLFLPGAEFLMAHRHDQLHNHEVFISTAVAVIGLLFDRQDMVDFGVYSKYGLVYQLEHGVQPSGLWFEGTFGYHFYALQSFMAYEAFALHTPHSHIHHPAYRRMLDMPFSDLQPDGLLPMLGDTTYNHFKTALLQYEFPYRELGGERMLAMLHLAYRDRQRDSLQALLYGVDTLPPCELQPPRLCHPEVGDSGHVVFRAEDGAWLLFKCDRYGGEHDHYDRLGLSVMQGAARVAPDLGTTGYGARLHYDYYKNTGAHNTVCIGGANQPPADARLTRLETVDGVTIAEAVCDWNEPFHLPDSFVMVQWDEEKYRTVRMTRRIAWTEDWWAEAFLVEGAPENETIDWILHLGGEWTDGTEGEAAPAEEPLSTEKPYRHLRHLLRQSGGTPRQHTARVDKVTTRVFSAAFGGETILASGPDNPSYHDMAYLIERARGGSALFAHVVDSRGRVTGAEFALKDSHADITVTCGEKVTTVHL